MKPIMFIFFIILFIPAKNIMIVWSRQEDFYVIGTKTGMVATNLEPLF